MSEGLDYEDAVALMQRIGEAAEGIIDELTGVESSAAALEAELNTLRAELGLPTGADVFVAAQAVELAITEAIVQAQRVKAIMEKGVAKFS
jgi:copper chaperone CopZ